MVKQGPIQASLRAYDLPIIRSILKYLGDFSVVNFHQWRGTDEQGKYGTVVPFLKICCSILIDWLSYFLDRLSYFG